MNPTQQDDFSDLENIQLRPEQPKNSESHKNVNPAQKPASQTQIPQAQNQVRERKFFVKPAQKPVQNQQNQQKPNPPKPQVAPQNRPVQNTNAPQQKNFVQKPMNTGWQKPQPQKPQMNQSSRPVQQTQPQNHTHLKIRKKDSFNQEFKIKPLSPGDSFVDIPKWKAKKQFPFLTPQQALKR